MEKLTETIQERYKRLSKEVDSKYGLYLRAQRKATRNKSSSAFQTEVDSRKRDWLIAVYALKMA